LADSVAKVPKCCAKLAIPMGKFFIAIIIISIGLVLGLVTHF